MTLSEIVAGAISALIAIILVLNGISRYVSLPEMNRVLASMVEVAK